ncbi:hypothetical protein ACMXY9_11830, partial [Pasteurella multocida]
MSPEEIYQALKNRSLNVAMIAESLGVSKGVDNVVSHIQETYSDEACLFALSQTTSFVSTVN